MKYIGQKFLIISAFIPVLIFGLLFFSRPANAQTISVSNNGGTVGIPSSENDTVLICSSQGGYCLDSSCRSDWMTYDGVNMTELGNAANSGFWGNGYGPYVYYVINPTAGDHTVVAKDSNPIRCLFVDDINPVVPFLTTTTGTYFNESNTTALNIPYTLTNSGDNMLLFMGGLNAGDYQQIISSSTNSIFLSGQTEYGGFNFSNFYKGGSTGSGNYELVKNGLYQTSGNYLSVELSPVSSGGGGEIEILDMATLENTYLWFNDLLQYCDVNTTCKLNYNYDTQLFNDDDIYKLYYYQNGTTTPQYLGEHILGTRFDITGESGSGYIIASSTATSSAFSYYQLVPYSSSLEKFMGTTTVGVWFQSTTSPETILNSYKDSSSGKKQDQAVVELIKVLCDPNDSDLECTVKVTPYFVYTKATNLLTNLANGGLKLLGNMFPFNFATLVDTTWKNSATTEVPEDLAWLIPTDENDEVVISWKILPTAPTSTVTIWSPDFFTHEAFGKVRGATKYLWYLVLVVCIYIYGKILYHDLIGKDEEQEII